MKSITVSEAVELGLVIKRGLGCTGSMSVSFAAELGLEAHKRFQMPGQEVRVI